VFVGLVIDLFNLLMDYVVHIAFYVQGHERDTLVMHHFMSLNSAGDVHDR